MTDWAPYWDYQWWKDIGLPALSAAGAIGIGGGTVWIAQRAHALSQRSIERDRTESSQKEADRAREARARFVGLVLAWSDSYTDGTANSDNTRIRRIAVDAGVGELPVEVDAQSVVRHIEDMTERHGLSRDSEHAVLTRDAIRYFLQRWVREPAEWVKVEPDAPFNAEDVEYLRKEYLDRWDRGEFERLSGPNL